MAKIEPRTLKGFRDYGPKEQLARQAMFQKIQTVFERFGFLPMSTPALEYKEILMGKIGEDEKLMYSFKDNGDRDVAMRYDLTVSLARYVAQNQGSLTLPFKRYQIAPVWRAENTQRGRLREFYQCDIDVVGSDSRTSDAEVIACIGKALEGLGVSDYELRINDRRNFDVFGATATGVIRAIDKLDKIGPEGVKAELERLGLPEQTFKLALDYIDRRIAPVYLAELEALKNTIESFGIKASNVVIDTNIARGLDYYSSMVFETVLPGQREFGSVASGGRYDGLVDTFSSQSLPAVGGSIGIDRVFEALEVLGKLVVPAGLQVVVLNMSGEYAQDYLRITTELRQQGVSAEFYYEPAKLDKQFKYAESKGARLAVMYGEEEKAKGVVKIKNLQTREQVEVAEKELLDSIARR